MKADPFSPDLVNAAILLVVEKTNEAVKRTQGDMDAANRLVWSWCQTNTALRLAFLRILFNNNAVRNVSTACCEAHGLTLTP
jgi:hypothetical protein